MTEPGEEARKRCEVEDYGWPCHLPRGHDGDHDYHPPKMAEPGEEAWKKAKWAIPCISLCECMNFHASACPARFRSDVAYLLQREIDKREMLVAQFSDLAVEMEKHSNDHIHDEEPATNALGAAVEGVCADRINSILKRAALKNAGAGA